MNKIYIRGNEMATKEYVDSLSFSGGNVDLSNYYTKEEIDTVINEIDIPEIDSSNHVPYYSICYTDNIKMTEVNSNALSLTSIYDQIQDIVNDVYAKGYKNFILHLYRENDNNGEYQITYDNMNVDLQTQPTLIRFGYQVIANSYTTSSFCRNTLDIGGTWTDNVFTLNYAYVRGRTNYYAASDTVLTKTNTTAFTPTADYHPVTKKYVDDAVMNVEGSGNDYIPTFVLNTGSTTDIFVSDITVSYSKYPEILQAFSEFLTECYAEGHDIINIVLKTSNNNTLLFNMMKSSFQTKPTYLSINALYFQNRTLSPDSNNPLTIIQGVLRMTWDDNNVVTVNSFETLVQRNYLLTTKNTDAYTPTGDYNPATKKYVDDAITASIAEISATSMEIATSLPTANISTSTIYLVKDETASTDTGNVYNEYIYINGAWENIGSTKTTVDLSKYSTTEELSQMLSTALSNYLTTADMNAALSSYYTKTATDEAIENAINNIEHPTTDLSNYYNKQEIDTMIGDINSILDTINGEEV